MEKKNHIRKLTAGTVIHVMSADGKIKIEKKFVLAGKITFPSQTFKYSKCILANGEGTPKEFYIFHAYFNDGYMIPVATPQDDQEAKKEQEALAKLRLAQKLIQGGKTVQGTQWLTEIVQKYPGTKAAQQAKEKLDTLK